MRTFLLIFSLFVIQNAAGQKDYSKKIAVGIANNSIFSWDNSGVESRKLFAPGVFGYFQMNARTAMEVGLFLEQRRFRFIDASLIFGSDILNGTTSVLVADVDERYAHWSHFFKFYFNEEKKLQPFFGLGYSLRFVTDVDGTRMINVSDGSTSELAPAENDKLYFHPGIQTNFGVDFFLEKKLLLTAQVGWNHFFKNKFSRYNPLSNQIDKDGVKYSFSNLVVRVGVGYFFQSKKGNDDQF